MQYKIKNIPFCGGNFSEMWKKAEALTENGEGWYLVAVLPEGHHHVGRIIMQCEIGDTVQMMTLEPRNRVGGGGDLNGRY